MFIEKLIVRHCSPTLAHIKTGNLFSVQFDDYNSLIHQLNELNELVAISNIKIKILNLKETTALIYVYRKTLLEAEISNQEVKDFLGNYGYTNFDIEEVLQKLDKRIIQNNDFPHEIGIFLGYPLEDVKAFIENKGKNYSCCGYWKVYTNKTESLKKFDLFDKCSTLYQNLWNNGSSIKQLIIA